MAHGLIIRLLNQIAQIMNKNVRIITGLTLAFIGTALLTQSCKTIPQGVVAVDDFEVDKYLGRWYEIARFDFKHERNMNNVTANYSLKPNGTIRVENRGYDTTKSKWKESIGVAKFAEDEHMGMLRVSFFRPFYSGYNVVKIDPEYQHALVIGESKKYMWILSRTPNMPKDVLQSYVEHAKSLGLKVENLVYVTHDLVK